MLLCKNFTFLATGGREIILEVNHKYFKTNFFMCGNTFFKMRRPVFETIL
jgi:hypothetical protein